MIGIDWQFGKKSKDFFGREKNKKKLKYEGGQFNRSDCMFRVE